MEDDNNLATTSGSSGPGVASNRSKQSGQGVKKKKYRCSRPRSRFSTSNKWSQQEKTRLLEGLKRFGEECDVLAEIVETKSAEEIERKIRSIKATGRALGSAETLEGSGVVKKAPLEAWIDLIQDLKFYEHQDYSCLIPKILGLITRNEHFEDSGIPNLDWRQIYQFFTDITEDRCTVTSLTDIESFVVLDLMHKLGDMLRNSDTTEQRHALDLKYHLISLKKSKQKIAEAFGNNFSDPDDVQCLEQRASNGLNELEAMPQETTAIPSNISASSSEPTTKDSHDLSNPSEVTPVTDDSNSVTDFVKPKLYTLNPLCIAAQHLKLQPHSNSQ